MERYGILENGCFSYAPCNKWIGGELLCNFNSRVDLMTECGYKPVREQPYPDGCDGCEVNAVYSDQGEYIDVSWDVTHADSEGGV